MMVSNCAQCHVQNRISTIHYTSGIFVVTFVVYFIYAINSDLINLWIARFRENISVVNWKSGPRPHGRWWGSTAKKVSQELESGCHEQFERTTLKLLLIFLIANRNNFKQNSFPFICTT